MLLLPIATIVIIAVVSLVFIVIVIVAVARSTCCKKKKERGKHEELDRFLQTEESEDDDLTSATSAKITKKLLDDDTSYEEGEFHFVEYQVVEGEGDKNEPVEPVYPVDEVADEVDVIENKHVDPPLDPIVVVAEDVVSVAVEVETAAQEEPPPPPQPIEPPQTVEPPQPIETPVFDAELIIEAPDEPTGSSRDDISDDTSFKAVDPAFPGRKAKRQISRSTQRVNSAFSEKATLHVSLQYIESVKCLKGNIVAISGLDFQAEHCPQEINFHLRFFPNKKFHIATKHKPVWEDTALNLTFTMGPVYTADLTSNKLRIKLYGKKTQRLTRSKCYGECALSLEDIIGKSDPVDFFESIMQRTSGSVVYSSDSGMSDTGM